MATTIGSNGLTLQQSSSDPASPTAGTVYYNTTVGRFRLYDGRGWSDVKQESLFLTRTIITTGFVMGGYRSSSPWKNVNEMAHATDVMTNKGDLLPTEGAYVSGACSLKNGYIWGADASWPGTSTTISGFNMWTYGTVSPSGLVWSRNQSGTVFKETEFAWICGGGSTGIDVFNLSTDTTLTTDQGGRTASYGDAYQSGMATHSGETKGFIWYDGGAERLTFATGTTSIANVTSTGVTQGGIVSQQKGISSKLDKGYGGNEGGYNSGYNYRKMSYITETYTTVGKPVGNSGEENYDMGQYHQYMMGMYNGDQNNVGHKFYYTTDTGYELGAGSVRTGVTGGSSGHCAWRGT